MRLMNRLAVASMVFLAVPALAAEPGIPAKFVSGETMMVARINLQHVKRQMIEDTMKAVIDGGALSKAGVVNPLESPEMQQMMAQMVMADAMTTQFVQMGATSVSIVMTAPEEEFSPPGMQMLMPASTAENGDLLVQMMGNFGMPAQHVSDANQHWVVFSPPGMNGGEGGGDAAAAAQFNTALAGMEGASISIVMLPVQQMRDQMMENIEDEEQAKMVNEMFNNTKWVGFSVLLGGAPNVTMAAELKDAASAEKVKGQWRGLLDKLASHAKEAEENEEEWPEDMPKPTAMAGKVTKAASMESTGTRVNVILDAKELRDLTTTFMIFADKSGADISEFLPMGGGF